MLASFEQAFSLYLVQVFIHVSIASGVSNSKSSRTILRCCSYEVKTCHIGCISSTKSSGAVYYSIIYEII